MLIAAWWATGISATDTDPVSDSIPADTTNRSKGNIIDRIIRYFNESNKEREDGKFDVSFIGGPHYSSDMGLGIGLVASSQYGHIYTDSVTKRHLHPEASLMLDVSTTGFVMVGLRGTHIFRDDSKRLIYNLEFSNYPQKFWGVGYENGRGDSWSKFDEVSVEFRGSLQFRLSRNLLLGPSLEAAWINAEKVREKRFWDGERLHMAVVGAGGILAYDTRDNLTAPRRGEYLSLEARLYPRLLGNADRHFMLVEAAFNIYRGVWKGGILAMRLHSALTWGNTPWCMLPTFGGSYDMRGYYEGRYRDNNEINITAEIRQHIWHRSSAVAWIGAGSIFPKISRFKLRHVLPNFGIGYRWEFKRNSNVRVDFGIGRGETSFIFNINEAF